MPDDERPPFQLVKPNFGADFRGFASGGEPTSRPAFTLHFYDDIQKNISTIDFVEDVLVQGSASVVYGASNSGKTFFALDLALHVSSGRTWRGKEVKQGGVVYVALEGSLGFNNRVTAWRDEIGGDTRACFAAITASVDMLRPDADVSRLIEAIKVAAARFEMPVALVVIDTLARAMAGGNENSPEDMGALVMHMDEVRAATGAALMFIHHSGKDEAKGARGHSSLRAAIDTEIEVVAEGGQHTASVVKQRELESGQCFGFLLRRIDIGQNDRGKPVTSCVVEHSEQSGQPQTSARLSGHALRCFELLQDVLATSGATGFHGAPIDIPSVPENWWRDRFYSSAMPGADPATKQRTFRRAADALLNGRRIGFAHGRVWLR